MTSVPRGRGAAPARAAIAGNPSDGYGGAVLATTLHCWSATAHATPWPTLKVDPPSSLVRATALRFARELEPAAVQTAIRWSTSIPRGVGLGGSSALVIATARALCDLHGVTIAPHRLADFALAVETEDLGITAGLQDRVAQAYGGVTFMDFGLRAEVHGTAADARYEPLDPGLLPPLLIAWRPDAACDSGLVHATLRERHRRGEAEVHEAMASLAAAARQARSALVAGDPVGFRAAVDRSFDLRRGMIALDARCREMVEVAREVSASANYTGSGGAIVAVGEDERHLDEVEVALRQIGCETVQYEITMTAGPPPP